MTKFIDCGQLCHTDGRGLEVPLILKIKNGVAVNDYKIDKELTKDGKFNFPVEIKEVKGYFDCRSIQLTSLEGCPQKVVGDFSCSYNRLTSLEGCPQKVFGDFNCQWNKITTLKGTPKDLGGGNFDCSGNDLSSLEGCPKYVGGHFDIRDNARKFTEEEVRAVCKVDGRVFV